MSQDTEKNEHQINFTITPTLMGRAEKIEQETKIKPTQLARSGFVAELNRLESRAPELDPQQISRLAKLRALEGLQVDVENLLESALIRAGDEQSQRTGT